MPAAVLLSTTLTSVINTQRSKWYCVLNSALLHNPWSPDATYSRSLLTKQFVLINVNLVLCGTRKMVIVRIFSDMWRPVDC